MLCAPDETLACIVSAPPLHPPAPPTHITRQSTTPLVFMKRKSNIRMRRVDLCIFINWRSISKRGGGGIKKAIQTRGYLEADSYEQG